MRGGGGVPIRTTGEKAWYSVYSVVLDKHTLVSICAGSDPWLGSVRPKQPTSSPLNSLTITLIGRHISKHMGMLVGVDFDI